MSLNSVKIQMPQQLYDMLKRDQERMRQQDGKKTSLADLIIHYCHSFLENKEEIMSLIFAKKTKVISADGSMMPCLEGSTPQVNEVLKKTAEEELWQQEQELQDRGKKLDQRETSLTEKHKQLLRIKEDNMNLMINTVKQKEENLYSSVNSKFQEERVKVLTAELDKKDHEVRQLRSELHDKDKTLDKMMTSLSRIENNTKKTIWDSIKPFIPVVSNIVTYFLAKRDMEKGLNLEDIRSDLAKAINGSSPEAQKAILDVLPGLAQLKEEPKEPKQGVT